MGGSSIFNASSLAQFGVYGSLGVPSVGNIPGSRSSASGWTDGTGNFWLFGGEGPFPVNGEWFLVGFNDLWRYQPSTTPSLTNAPAPTFGIAAGTYTSVQTVTISDADPGATIYYTTDGSIPTLNSTTYTGPITVSVYSTIETINAIAVASGYLNSAVASATYVINLPASSTTVTTIASSLNPSNVGEYVTFTATVYPVSSSATPAGTVLFSMGNSLSTSPLAPPVALNSSGVATLTTAAVFGCGENITAAYTPNSGSSFAPSVSAPLQQNVAGAPPGESATTLTSSQNPSNTGQSVTLTATVVGGPPFTNFLCGGGPPIGSGTYAPSGVYGTVQFYANGTAIGPQISVGGGGSSGVANYSTSTLPTGTDAITAQYFEGNGYAPSNTSNAVSQVVTGSAPVQAAATPTFSVASGTYTAAQTVTISDATAGAAIYYTTDCKTTPTANSTLYTGAITVAATETIQAIAVAPNYAASAVASATYTVNLPVPAFTIAPSPSSLTLTAGQSGAVAISVTPLNGFNSQVSFSCSGLPSGASCSFSPPTVTPVGGMASTTLTVTTSTTTVALDRDSRPLLPVATLAVALCCFGWSKRRRLLTILLLAVSVFGLSLLTSCSQTFTSGGLPVTSTVTVTATADSLQSTMAISLTVN